MDGKRKLHGYFNTKTLWITVIVLLLLTLITSGLIVGLYARQVTAQEKTDGAVVAAAGGAVVYEHKAEVIPDRSDVKNGIYKLNMDVKVTKKHIQIHGMKDVGKLLQEMMNIGKNHIKICMM